ncbi:MAG: M48 family metallopeptidase [Candidatus Binataceae bacterium]
MLPALAVAIAICAVAARGWASDAPGQSAQATATTAGAANPAAAPQPRGYTLPKEKYQKAIAYSRAGYRLYFAGVPYEALVLLAVLGLGWGSKFRDLAERASRFRFVQAVVFTSLLLVTLGIARLPLGAYGHWLAVKYEQSVQGWPSWLWDAIKGQFVAIVIYSVSVWILYGIIRRSPRRWWFHFWLATIPLGVLMAVVSPVVIEPLFNNFEPLAAKQPALAAEMERVMARGGLKIPPERMLEMKASEKMKSLDAYVTGFGPTKRVVVYDTTIAKMSTPEILFVFGHEMGHYVLCHILKGMVFGSALFLAGLYLAFLWIDWAVARWGSRWGIRSVDDWASLPALMLFAAVFGFLVTPVGNAYSRYYEHQADVYGLEAIHSIVPNSAQVAAQAFQVLGEVDLADPAPPPFIRFWLYSHPPLNERIVFAQSYDPWSKGESPQFVK